MATIEISERVSTRSDLPGNPTQVAHEFNLNGRIRRRRHLETGVSTAFAKIVARRETSKGLPPALKPQFVHA